MPVHLSIDPAIYLYVPEQLTEKGEIFWKGKVKKNEHKQDSNYYVIDVELFEDLSSLSSVYITSNYDKNELETLKIDNEIN